MKASPLFYRVIGIYQEKRSQPALQKIHVRLRGGSQDDEVAGELW